MTAHWLPGLDRRAVRHPARPGAARVSEDRRVVVVGGGIAGIAAATALAERGVAVTLVEQHERLGGRVRSWPVTVGAESQTMGRGFHAFFRQYYNLRALLRRTDPTLAALAPIPDYPVAMADGHTDSFGRVARMPPLNLLSFVARSPNFSVADLFRADINASMELLDVEFPATFEAYDDESAAHFLDRLRFPPRVRHLALEVFTRSFFDEPRFFSAGELLTMFHLYFLGSAEGLLFDSATDDFDTSLWAPARSNLERLGVQVLAPAAAVALIGSDPDRLDVEVGYGSGGRVLPADAVVLATNLGTTRRLIAAAPDLGTSTWRDQVAAAGNAPPFAVWRVWLDRPVRPDRPAFLGTTGFGLMDNVSVLERFEAGAAEWSRRHGGSVVELHAYALAGSAIADDVGRSLQRRLRAELGRVFPETIHANVLGAQWLAEQDCPAFPPGAWSRRPTVQTSDHRLVLAGDGIRCDLPVALMERAATTGFQAANELLARWGAAGHDLWSVPMRGRVRPAVGYRRLRGYTPTSPREPTRKRGSA